jgi:hypothetical protein
MQPVPRRIGPRSSGRVWYLRAPACLPSEIRWHPGSDAPLPRVCPQPQRSLVGPEHLRRSQFLFFRSRRHIASFRKVLFRQSRLFQDTLNHALRKILTRVAGDSYRPTAVGMVILPVAASRSGEPPSLRFHQLHRVANLQCASALSCGYSCSAPRKYHTAISSRLCCKAMQSRKIRLAGKRWFPARPVTRHENNP